MNGNTRSLKVPAIILSGFLGAGKTTLLNRILTADHGRRIAVIVNEFGEVGIDHHLLISSEQEIVQMNNGCICCTVRGDLLRSLFQLMEHRANFDTLLIETTGLADPGPVAQTIYLDERIRSEFTLHGVVTVVDSKHIWNQIDHSVEAREQIAFADLVLLNKTDLATPEELNQLEEKVGSLNRVAKIVRTRNSDVDLAAIFDMESAQVTPRIESPDPPHSGPHEHLRDISTVCLVESGELDGMKVSQWFRLIIGEFGPTILRMKGILSLRGDPDQFIFQGVHAVFEGKPGRPWGNEERVNRLVFIGRELDKNKITEGFHSCLFTGDRNSVASLDAFGRDVEVSPFTLDQIRYWMRQNFGFPKDAPIIIKEVPCVKPGCPPIETAIIAILKNEPPRLFKVQETINNITFDHVYNLIENPLPCC